MLLFFQLCSAGCWSPHVVPVHRHRRHQLPPEQAPGQTPRLAPDLGLPAQTTALSGAV